MLAHSSDMPMEFRVVWDPAQVTQGTLLPQACSLHWTPIPPLKKATRQAKGPLISQRLPSLPRDHYKFCLLIFSVIWPKWIWSVNYKDNDPISVMQISFGGKGNPWLYFSLSLDFLEPDPLPLFKTNPHVFLSACSPKQKLGIITGKT